MTNRELVKSLGYNFITNDEVVRPDIASVIQSINGMLKSSKTNLILIADYRPDRGSDNWFIALASTPEGRAR